MRYASSCQNLPTSEVYRGAVINLEHVCTLKREERYYIWSFVSATANINDTYPGNVFIIIGLERKVAVAPIYRSAKYPHEAEHLLASNSCFKITEVGNIADNKRLQEKFKEMKVDVAAKKWQMYVVMILKKSACDGGRIKTCSTHSEKAHAVPYESIKYLH